MVERKVKEVSGRKMYIKYLTQKVLNNNMIIYNIQIYAIRNLTTPPFKNFEIFRELNANLLAVP